MALNLVVVSGRLVADPDIRVINVTGTQSARGTIAVERNYKTADGQYETDFIDYQIFGQLADTMQRLKKGDYCILQGSWRINRVNQIDGTIRTYHSLAVDKVIFTPSAKKENQPKKEDELFNFNPLDADLPF